MADFLGTTVTMEEARCPGFPVGAQDQQPEAQNVHGHETSGSTMYVYPHLLSPE